MRALYRRATALVIGVGITAVVWRATGWRATAVGIGAVYALGAGLLVRAQTELRSRVRARKRPSPWSGVFAALVTFAALLVANALPDTTGFVAGLAVIGAGLAGMAAGIGVALENIDAESDRPAGESEPPVSDADSA